MPSLMIGNILPILSYRDTTLPSNVNILNLDPPQVYLVVTYATGNQL
jgi:hypothetical protein